MRLTNLKTADFKEVIMAKIFLMSAVLSILLLLLIFVFLFANGLPAIGEIGLINFITGREWRPRDGTPAFGILPMIATSIYTTLGAIVIGVPIGIFTAVFLAHMCPQWIYRFIKPAISLLAGIPSVVYGYFGMMVIVPQVREINMRLFGNATGATIFSAMVLLGIMILPTIINISETAIRAVPESYYQGALALGASHERSVFFVTVPAAKSGIFASIILGIGRAVGETMAVVMVAGNQPRIPTHLFQGGRTLTSNIVMEMGYADGLHSDALVATGIVLLIFILIINVIFTLVTRKTGQ